MEKATRSRRFESSFCKAAAMPRVLIFRTSMGGGGGGEGGGREGRFLALGPSFSSHLEVHL